MIGIEGQNIYKYYGRQCVLEGLYFSFKSPEAIWIAGSNGRGKSTLLNILAGLTTPEKGRLCYTWNGNPLDVEDVRPMIAFCAPYQELPWWLTVEEIIRFQGRLRPWTLGLKEGDIPELCQLEGHRRKRVDQLSSGMRQRLRLILAWVSTCQALFLDEPCTHLDADGQRWYQSLYEQWGHDKLVVVCSNNTPAERGFCTKKLDLDQWKV